MTPEWITVVSGLPRSGTSMLMRMLEAGGMELLVDDRRPADDSNPRGYFEFDPVKRLDRDASWIPRARGRVVKIVSPLLRHLPAGETYRILFMQRNLEEILASQQSMLRRLGQDADGGDELSIAESFGRHLRESRQWIDGRDDVEALFLRHRQIMSDPRNEAERIQSFLRLDLDVDAMATAVDPTLHRERA